MTGVFFNFFRFFLVHGIVRTSSGEFVKSKGTGQVDPEITGMIMHDFLTSLHEMRNLACEPSSKYTAV